MVGRPFLWSGRPANKPTINRTAAVRTAKRPGSSSRRAVRRSDNGRQIGQPPSDLTAAAQADGHRSIRRLHLGPMALGLLDGQPIERPIHGHN